MPDAVVLGPLLLRTLASAVVVGALVSVALVNPIGRRAGVGGRALARTLEISLLVALLGSRVAHVLGNLPAYADRPWTALYLWLPGYSPVHGVALGLVTALLLLRRRPPAERGRDLQVLATASVGGITAGGLLFAMLVALAPPVTGPGARLPEFALEDLQGRVVRWSETAGQPVILNFWATWCAPCRREMPLLDETARMHAGRGLRVIGVAVGESAGAVSGFAAATPVAYPLWVDPAGGTASPSRILFDQLGGVGLPTTYFVAADGRVAGRVTGELSAALLAEWVERLLAR